jgi:primary-amine oxidase
MTLISDPPTDAPSSPPRAVRPAGPPPAHPLEPLAPQEIQAARDILVASAQYEPGCRFVFIELAEPAKELVAGWAPGDPWDRHAAVLLRNPGRRGTYRALVSLHEGSVLSWELLDGVQPPMMFEEFMACEQLVCADPQWRAAMRRRGIEDFSLAMVDPWAAGYTGPDDSPGQRRLARPLTFVRSGPDDNGYARPVEGLIVTVDLDAMTVVEVLDHGVVPLPPKPGNYYPELIGDPANVPPPGQREPLRPIAITQPSGPSFTVEGHHIAWANWRLRLGFTPREGLVLHDVGVLDRGTLRPVLYRASLSEMYVPYGDPNPTHWNKNVFDEGEYGLGWLANSLQLGCDCLGEIRYFDGYVNDQDGNPVRIANAICLHEEDASIGWKHTDFRTERGEVRRNRRLVVSFVATVGNYEYGFYWSLYLDGTIEFEVKLTGILSTGALPIGEQPDHGTLIAPGLYAPNHEHYFCIRLDTQVDSPRNNLFEVSSVAAPTGPDNPHGNAWRVENRHLRSESEAQRQPDGLHGRSWLITSADTATALGARPSYRLEPGNYTAPLWREGSEQAMRGGFATHQLWGTPFDPAERFAAGEFVAQNPGPDGLVAYTAGDRSLVDADLVLWYVAGAHHIVRPEDWPVMPVSRVGFHLKPFGFFDGNPMIGLPPDQPTHHGHAEHEHAHDAGGGCACAGGGACTCAA